MRPELGLVLALTDALEIEEREVLPDESLRVLVRSIWPAEPPQAVAA
jgi:hypothetical protein